MCEVPVLPWNTAQGPCLSVPVGRSCLLFRVPWRVSGTRRCWVSGMGKCVDVAQCPCFTESCVCAWLCAEIQERVPAAGLGALLPQIDASLQPGVLVLRIYQQRCIPLARGFCHD